MSAPIFDELLRQLRRARAARTGGDRFLHDRAFDDCLDRLADIRKTITSALIVGHANDKWTAALSATLPDAIVTQAPEGDVLHVAPASFDLCLSIGELETSADLITAAFTLRQLLAPGGLLLGAIVGGDSLPRLRAAMLAADLAGGGATPRIHPSIDGPSLSALLSAVGFVEPVVDVDRLNVSYANLDRLVEDLRAMGCSNILAERSRRPLTRGQVAIARSAFLDGNDRATERFDLLHFAAWAPQP